MKTRTIIIIAIIAVILALIAYFMYQSWQRKKMQQLLSGVQEKGTTTGTQTSSTGTTTTGFTDAFPLSIGSKGRNVEAAQVAVNKACMMFNKTIAVDGVFGPQTETAIDICLASQPGHIKGKLTYAEYKYLSNKAASISGSGSGSGASFGSTTMSAIEKLAEPCSTAAGRLFVESTYGIRCADYGY